MHLEHSIILVDDYCKVRQVILLYLGILYYVSYVVH